jgi:hypothetical protein
MPIWCTVQAFDGGRDMDVNKFKRNLDTLWIKNIPPMPVKPSNTDRITSVRDVIRRKYKLSRAEAEFTTSALFGFMSPDVVREVCYSSKYDYQLEAPDEQCAPEDVIKRRREQANTLVTLLEINLSEAKEVVSRIRPTACNWKPTLRKPKWHGQPTVTA